MRCVKNRISIVLEIKVWKYSYGTNSTKIIPARTAACQTPIQGEQDAVPFFGQCDHVSIICISFKRMENLNGPIERNWFTPDCQATKVRQRNLSLLQSQRSALEHRGEGVPDFPIQRWLARLAAYLQMPAIRQLF